MKQYLLSIYQPDGEAPAPEVLEPIMRDLDAVNQELKAAGAWVFSGGLHSPSTATVVRLKDGDVLIIDGPYIEGKEHIGGFTVIQAPDLDAALEWAASSPGRSPSRSRSGRCRTEAAGDLRHAGDAGIGDRARVPRGARPRGGRPGPRLR